MAQLLIPQWDKMNNQDSEEVANANVNNSNITKAKLISIDNTFFGFTVITNKSRSLNVMKKTFTGNGFECLQAIISVKENAKKYWIIFKNNESSQATYDTVKNNVKLYLFTHIRNSSHNNLLF